MISVSLRIVGILVERLTVRKNPVPLHIPSVRVHLLWLHLLREDWLRRYPRHHTVMVLCVPGRMSQGGGHVAPQDPVQQLLVPPSLYAAHGLLIHRLAYTVHPLCDRCARRHLLSSDLPTADYTYDSDRCDPLGTSRGLTDSKV